MIRLEVRITDDLCGESQEKLEDQLAEWLRLKNLHGEVESLTTGNFMTIDNEERCFEMRIQDLLGVEVSYPQTFWAEKTRRDAGEK
jgi:hypothetical protein